LHGVSRQQLQAVLGLALLLGVFAAPALLGIDAFKPTFLAAIAFTCLALVWIACYTEPAVLFSIAIVLAPFSANWQELGIPGAVAPDRLVLAGAVLAVAVRTPGARDRPGFRLERVHLLLVLAATWAVSSAYLSGTLFQKRAFFALLEAYGVLPFAVFAVAPLVFRSERERAVLLRALVLLGAYLSLTALFETTGPRALVFPRYISDPNYGIQGASWGRARGPFAEAATNGVALYVCAVASVIACFTWKTRAARFCAAAIAALCLLGTLFTLQRAVWIAAAVASLVTLLGFRQLRRYLVLAAVAGALAVAAAFVLIPGLQAKVIGRSHDKTSIYDRQNLNAAALAAVEAHPLTGIGWNRFLTRNVDFFHQASGAPLVDTATVSLVLKPSITAEPVHNVFLGYAAELGLVGLALWLAALATGVGGALLARAPPPLALWRVGLIAVTIAILLVAATVPPSNFPMLMLCLWAGVVWSGRTPTTATA
jgi:putative inorganic carbon (hco3(-)) transporter